jgi:hypothetical protein
LKWSFSPSDESTIFYGCDGEIAAATRGSATLAGLEQSYNPGKEVYNETGFFPAVM